MDKKEFIALLSGLNIPVVNKDKIKKSDVLAALEKVLAREESTKSLKAPKEWWDKMVKEIKEGNPDYSEEQIKKTIGDIWANKLSDEKKKAIKKRYGKKYAPAK